MEKEFIPEKFKIKFISDEFTGYLEKGEIYEGYYIKDDPLKKWIAITVEEEDGLWSDLAFPSKWFNFI